MASPNRCNSPDENKPGHSQEVVSAEKHAPLQQSGSASHPQSFSRRFLSPRTLTPTAVLVGHSLLLIFSWTFFAATAKKPRAVPAPWAIEVKNNLQSVVWVTSTVASGLALVSSVLYTLAIKYLLTRVLAERVSLFAIASAVQLSQKSLIINAKRPWWTIGAALCLLAVTQQTPSWSTLLIPKEIQIQSLMSGYELDLMSIAFQNDLAAAGTYGPFFTTNVPSLMVSAAGASGGTAIKSFFEPSILNFDRFSYTNSTMGIMPISAEEIGNTTSITGRTPPVRAVVHKMAKTPAGFPVRFNLTQQGFTVQVSCQQRNATLPLPILNSQNVSLLAGGSAQLQQLRVPCDGGTGSSISEPVLTSDNVAVLGTYCPVNQTGESQRWDLTLYGSGSYDFIGTTVCRVFPEINMVNISYYGDYTKLSNSSSPNFIEGSQPWGGQDAPWLLNFCIEFFLQGLALGQSTTGNLMGDTIKSIRANFQNGTQMSVEDALAQYIRGVAEASVTLLRYAYTLDPGGSGEIPVNMRSNITGIYSSGTMGWKQSVGTAGGVLLAPTFVSIMSILIIVVTLMKKGDVEPGINGLSYFKPSDSLIDVISVASARGVSGVNFQTYDEKTAKYRDTITLTLAQAGESGTK